MAANLREKLAIVDINAGTQALLQGYLDLGYHIISITSLTPTFTKLLIVYRDPASDPIP
jgi:hypothetical protein